jgi:hypothetical protein
MTAGSALLTSPSSSFTAADVGKYIQVIGAGAGSTSHTDGAISDGSAVLTSASGTFASTDVGRGIVVIGAGPSGGNLVTSIQSYSAPDSVTLSAAASTSVAGATYYYGAMTLEGTVQGVQNGTTISLSAPALATISGATFAYGTENHTAFQNAVDTAGQAGGGVVSVPAPSSCPSGATCGYVLRATDQMTAKAPGAVKIRYNGVSLAGDAPQTNLFCRGAFGVYTDTVAFPGVTGDIRGNCLAIGDNGGPNGTAGEAVSNVTISNLHLYGMTNGNTFNVSFGYPLQTPTGDGWDITHKAIYMWDNSSFSNITVNSVITQDFKAENIYSGGSVVTGMVIVNSTLTNFNGNGISMLAADLQVLNCTISNGSNAAVENSTVSAGGAALIRQLYQGNTISRLAREGIVVVGVDGGVASGYVQITNNTFDTIAEINGSGTESAVYIGSQNNYVPPANVTVTGNMCHDCYSFGVFETSGNTLVQGNTFTVDQHPAGSVFAFMYPLTGLTISNNTGSATAHAQASGLSVGAVYLINPGYATGGFAWKNVVLTGNNWTFARTPQYEFVTTSGLGWQLVTLDNLNWQGDVCSGCTHADVNHGAVNLAQTTVIEPYGPVVYVTGNSSGVTATVNALKQEDGSQIQIVNAGSNAVSFVSDANMSLPSTITLPGGNNNSVNFFYHASVGRWTTSNSATATISASGGTPQSATVNTAFGTALQATVTGSGNSPMSGVSVTFTAPSSEASASFGGSASATVVTGASGVATAPVLTANGQAGSYVVTASAAGVGNAAFSLTNTLSVTGTGGVLGGSGASSAAAVNLTAEGGLDWVHWGDGSLNRKAGVTAQISSDNVIGTGSVLTYSNDPRPVSWTDGTPTAASSNNMNGIYISGVGQGFSFTAPADTTARTLVAHVGGWNSGGTLTAHLSDGSAPDFVDVTSAASGQFDRNYTLSYSAGAAGQTLTVSWVMSSGLSGGNVTLNAAALVGASATATSGTPQSTTVGTAFPTALQATVSDSGGNPVSGAVVTFTAPGTGPTANFAGSASATSTTNSSGIAIAPTLTAGSQAGTYQVIATVAGLATSASFSLTNLAAGPASVTATAGTPQSATVNTAFAAALQATVKDASGNPLSGVTVTFAAPASGASATLGGSATVTTNTSGVATSPVLTANGQAGSYNVTASVAGVTTPASFSLTNTAATKGGTGGTLSGSANSNSGTFNLTTEGTTDWVNWGNVSGGPGIADRKAGVTAQISNYKEIGSLAVGTTGNDPRTLTWSDGTPNVSGPNSTVVYVDSNSGHPGEGFSFTVPADTNMRTLAFYAGGQDGGGTLTVSLSDGSAANYQDTTANQSSRWDRNYTITYSAASAGQALTIQWVSATASGSVSLGGAALSLAGSPGSASSITATAGAPQSATVNTAFATPLQATVKDVNGNPLSGVSVTFAAPASGASATFGGSATVTTNTSGVATAPALTANGQAGSYTVTASVAGVTTPASFSLTNLAAGPASVTATAGTPQSATVNTAFATALQATVRDTSGNLLSGVTVTFAAPASGASATFGGSATVTTNTSGVATAPALTANGQAGSYSVTASVAGVATSASFSLTNMAATKGGSGSLSGSANSNSGTFNLTTEGTTDWVNWGVISGGPGIADRKAGVTAQISNYTEIGSLVVGTTGNDPRTLTWSDGTPNVSGSNSTVVYVDSNSGHPGEGFSFTVPAGTTTHTLVFHAGGQNGGGTLTVSLSDGSAANYQDTTANQSGRWDRNYTITYNSASAGQTLTIQWVSATASGNVSLGGAALQ